MHGGDIYNNKVNIDFSVNTNPLGMPDFIMNGIMENREIYSNYPDYENFELRQAIANKYNQKIERIVCGNGASELINSICMYLLVKRTAVRALLQRPCFSGYEKALLSIGATIDFYEDISEIDSLDGIDVIFIANPNNPTGKLTDKNKIISLLDKSLNSNTLVVIDECFIELCDFYEDNTLIDYIDSYSNLIILRALTKSFAMAGIRLGYIICQNDLYMKGIRDMLPEWNVNGIANIAGRLAFLGAGDDYLSNARQIIGEGRKYLSKELRALGFKVINSDCNFILFKDEEATNYTNKRLYYDLLSKGILIRDCSDYRGLSEGYYRIAVKTMKENMILISNIKAIIKERNIQCMR